MEKILQLQDAFGSLIDIVPEPKKSKRKHHFIAMFYDVKNSDVSSAWAESVNEISDAYVTLVKNKADISRLKKLHKNYCKEYEYIINLEKMPSINELELLVDAVDDSFDLSSLKDMKKVETLNERK